MQRRRRSRHKKAQTARFSLLLLEVGEYFLEDFSAYRFLEPSAATHRKVHGRIKACTRGLFFVPDDLSLPILRFPFRSMLAEPVAECFVEAQASSALPVTTCLTFRCRTVVEMKQRGMDHPYVYREPPESTDATAPSSGLATEPPSRYMFTLLYTSIEAFLASIHVVYEVANLPRRALPKVEEEALLAPVLAPRLVSEFDPSLLVDFRERLVLSAGQRVDRIEPLVRYPGCIMLSDKRVYFQPAQLNNVLDPVLNWEYTDVEQVYRRRYLLRNTGLEIYFKLGDSCFFSFDTSKERDAVYDALVNQPELLRCRRKDLEFMMRKWQRREVSNFDYLLFLNNAAGRTRNDLTQYPVFPWVLCDYTSSRLDLGNPGVYRDLSKPIGALNPERLEFFKMRYDMMPRGDEAEGMPPPFLYGTHYSTPGYVLYFLVRMAPEYMLCLQNGKFDAPDRLFRSIQVTWEGCLTSHTDVKELIPEFFDVSFPSDKWLRNLHHLDLGTTQRLQRVDAIELPPWAHNDPATFVRLNREALESDHVSQNLHRWIDLIFGYKQQGEEAVKADNVFYYLSYEGAVDLDAIDDPVEKASLESQIQEFGQTPKLLFSTPHPPRSPNHGKIDLATPDLVPSPRFPQQEVRRRSFPVEAARRRMLLHSSTYTDGYDSDDEEDTGAMPYQDHRRHRYSLLCVQSTWSSVPRALERLTASLWATQEWQGTPKQWEWKAKLDSSSLSWTKASLRIAHGGEVTCIVLSRTGNLILSASKDCSLKITSASDGSVCQDVLFDSPLSCCDVSPDEQLVFVGCWDNHVYMYSVKTRRVIDRRFAHSDGISAICASRKRFLTSSWDSTIKLWSYSSRRISTRAVRTFLECNDSVLCLDASTDGLYAAAGVRNGHVYLFDLAAAVIARDVLVSPCCLGDVASVSFAADSKSFVCVTIENELLQFSLEGEQLWRIESQTPGQIRCFESDGEFAVGGTTSGRLHFWKLHAPVDNELVYSVPEAHGASISALVVSSDGATVVSGATDGTVRVWKLAEASAEAKLETPVTEYEAVLTAAVSIREDYFAKPRKHRSKVKKLRYRRDPAVAFYAPGIPVQAAEAQLCLEM